MTLISKNQSGLGGMLIIAGLLCILVWFFLKYLWLIGLALILVGIILFISSPMSGK